MLSIRDCTRPVIAALSGITVGGGLGLALACDLRVADETIRTGIPAGKLGLVYNPLDCRLLAQRIGVTKAKEILFTARIFGFEDAMRLGLVDRVAKKDALGTARELAAEIADNAPLSIAGSKAILNAVSDGTAMAQEEELQSSSTRPSRAPTMAKACERLASVARLDSAGNEARWLQLPAGRAGCAFVARVQLLQTLIAARITGIMMPKLKMNLTMAAMPFKRGPLPDRALLADGRAATRGWRTTLRAGSHRAVLEQLATQSRRSEARASGLRRFSRKGTSSRAFLRSGRRSCKCKAGCGGRVRGRCNSFRRAP